MSNFWSKEEEIGRVKKNKNNEIVVKKCERKNIEYLDVRIYSYDNYTDNFVPTSKGFNIEVDKAKELLDFIQQVINKER